MSETWVITAYSPNGAATAIGLFDSYEAAAEYRDKWKERDPDDDVKALKVFTRDYFAIE